MMNKLLTFIVRGTTTASCLLIPINEIMFDTITYPTISIHSPKFLNASTTLHWYKISDAEQKVTELEIQVDPEEDPVRPRQRSSSAVPATSPLDDDRNVHCEILRDRLRCSNVMQRPQLIGAFFTILARAPKISIALCRIALEHCIFLLHRQPQCAHFYLSARMLTEEVSNESTINSNTASSSMMASTYQTTSCWPLFWSVLLAPFLRSTSSEVATAALFRVMNELHRSSFLSEVPSNVIMSPSTSPTSDLPPHALLLHHCRLCLSLISSIVCALFVSPSVQSKLNLSSVASTPAIQPPTITQHLTNDLVSDLFDHYLLHNSFQKELSMLIECVEIRSGRNLLSVMMVCFE